jgi:transposase-like protein
MATATASKTIKGFQVTCPFCKDEDATISLDLNDLSSCQCSSCDETFSPARARDLVAAELARWERVVRWVDSAAAILAEGE